MFGGRLYEEVLADEASTMASTRHFQKTPQSLATKGFHTTPIPDHPPSSLIRGGGQGSVWCVLVWLVGWCGWWVGVVGVVWWVGWLVWVWGFGLGLQGRGWGCWAGGNTFFLEGYTDYMADTLYRQHG